MNRFPAKFILSVLLGVAGCGRGTAFQAPDPGQRALIAGQVVAEKSLFITDLSVVEARPYTTWNNSYPVYDSRGAWTFGRLIDNMLPYGQRNAIGRSRFVMRWLKKWEQPQTVNGFVVPARPLMRSQIIDPWRRASNCASTVTDENCNLNFGRAPFRLLAIVNRPDLRRPVNGTQLPSGGQGRFVFGALGPTGAKLLFTVIFEYDLPVTDFDIPGIDDAALETRLWGEAWHALSDLPFGPEYNYWLFNITSQFTGRDRTPSRRNGSALFQIRTNEVALSPVPGDSILGPVGPFGLWEMREFVIGASGQLVQTTVKQEPDASFNGSAALGAYVAENAAAILAGQNQVPTSYQGRAFLGGAAPVPITLQWSVPGADEPTRHAFALSTCNGCHRPETRTFFLHVRPREAGAQATVSAFVTSELAGPRKADYELLLNVPLTAYLLGPGLDIGHGDFD